MNDFKKYDLEKLHGKNLDIFCSSYSEHGFKTILVFGKCKKNDDIFLLNEVFEKVEEYED